MPRRAHRRCKVQGPTCNGVAHPGFDNCARCLHDVIKPRLKAQKEATRMKRREDMVKHTRSPENRKLISEVDPKEPQLQPEPTWLVPEQAETAEGPGFHGHRAIHRAITEMETDHEIAGLAPLEAVEKVANILIHDILAEEPVKLTHAQRRRLRRQQRVEEEPTTPVTPRNTKPKLTEAQEDEVIELFKSGISTTEIQNTYNIGPQTLYTLVRKRGIPLRTQGTSRTGPKHPPQEEPVPPVKASEPVSTGVPYPPPPNGAVAGLPEWVVTYEVRRTETAIIAAKDFNAAAAAAANEPGIEVISVARKRD